jgi:hypothetical protein
MVCEVFLYCKRLEKNSLGAPLIRVEEISDPTQLQEGQTGTCLSGQRGSCPDNCGQVIIAQVYAPRSETPGSSTNPIGKMQPTNPPQ